MSLTLGRQGGIAQPLKKRTVGQTNIAHVYDGANHIWPTSVIHFSDFTSVQLRYIWGRDDGLDLDTKSYYVNSPWFKDVDFDGDKVWEYFHMNN